MVSGVYFKLEYYQYTNDMKKPVDATDEKLPQFLKTVAAFLCEIRNSRCLVYPDEIGHHVSCDLFAVFGKCDLIPYRLIGGCC